MRAFMSANRIASVGQTLIELADITRCTVFAPPGGSCEKAVVAAEREARHILAETEPQGCRLDCGCHDREDAEASLADALRAFVEGGRP